LAAQRPRVRSRDTPSCLAIRNPRRGRRAVLSSLGTDSPEDRSKRGFPSSSDIHSRAACSPDIHSPEDRRGRGIPRSLGIRNPAARSLENRNRDIHRPGSHNKCPVAAEVYSRRPLLFRLLRRSRLRGLLPARHPPLLQWQHRRLLPIRPHQGRAEQDHKGWCRPRDSRPTRQSYRAQFGSLSLSHRPFDRIEPTTTTDTSHPFSR
jgi:hypothetical protein